MPCFHPVKGFFGRQVNDTGKRSLVFTSDRSLVSSPVQVPCGRCIGCRLDRSLSWAVRCVHEAQMHEDNCFLTLTYDEKHLPKDGSLRPRDFVLFMKRLRHYARWHDRDGKLIKRRWYRHLCFEKLAFFQCGEYGEKGGRPHHHVCLFGWRPFDLVCVGKSESGCFYYGSELVRDLWGQGNIFIGDVTFESAAYVARYVLKKWSIDDLKEDDLYKAMKDYDLQVKTWKKSREKFFEGVTSRSLCIDAGKSEFYSGRRPEFVTMSRRPGIGDSWYAKFKGDLFPHGFAVLPSGKTVRVPQYYDLKFSLDDPFKMAIIKGERLAKAEACPDNSASRLLVREKVKKLTINQLKRGYEYEG